MEQNSETAVNKNQVERLKGGIFLAGVAGISVISGAAVTIGLAKKQDSHMFSKGMLGGKEMSESGASLALRALGRATVYSVAGFSVFCFVAWKALGVHSLVEFREKMQSLMPKFQRKEPQGRSDFSSFRELFKYLADESEKGKLKDNTNRKGDS